MYKDNGHYYVNGVLIEDMTKTKCREAGGIPSVTTKIASWIDPGLMFWKIGENVDAAYRCLEKGIDLSLEDFRRVVADEYYSVHNEIRLGNAIHDILHKLISQGVEPRLFMSFYKEYAAPEISELFEAVQLAFEWFKEHFSQATTESVVYNKELGISGTCDATGLLNGEDGQVVGGCDWKCTFVKKHPGWKKADRTMKSLKIHRRVSDKLQLGAYGRVLDWKGAYIVKISTNPMVPGIQPQWYSHEALVEGYKAYGHIARAYDILNGFI